MCDSPMHDIPITVTLKEWQCRVLASMIDDADGIPDDAPHRIPLRGNDDFSAESLNDLRLAIGIAVIEAAYR